VDSGSPSPAPADSGGPVDSGSPSPAHGGGGGGVGSALAATPPSAQAAPATPTDGNPAANCGMPAFTGANAAVAELPPRGNGGAPDSPPPCPAGLPLEIKSRAFPTTAAEPTADPAANCGMPASAVIPSAPSPEHTGLPPQFNCGTPDTPPSPPAG
jgi:hypothetical protein